MLRKLRLPYFALLAILFWSCFEFDSKEKVAQRACGSCHMFPSPELLDKATWKEHILPRMGVWLGYGNRHLVEDELYGDRTYGTENLKQLIPEEPTISESDWKKIQDYYLENAPDSIFAESKPVNFSDLGELFAFRQVKLTNKQIPALNTLLKYDPKDRLFYSGSRNGLYEVYNEHFDKVDSTVFQSASSALVKNDDGSVELLLMGEIQPNNEPRGTLLKMEGSKQKEILQGLFRPVAFEKVDLNEDGRLDYLMANYGFHIGKLSWFEQLESGKFLEHILLPVPGAIQFRIDDFNKDGRPDIVALMTQGDEAVYAFENMGRGFFKPDKWVQFPPVYGTSAFEWIDLDGDGFKDIVTVNGDNADYSVIEKPYHGVRILKNDGQNHFKEVKFMPLKGATGLKVNDFDQDGDLDLAVTANYAHFADSPQRGFVLYRNEGNLEFEPYISSETDCGRWLVMEEADIDEDGDLDLILGSHMMPLLVGSREQRNWWEQHVNFLVLENKSKP